MPDAQQLDFMKRLKKIDRYHRKLAHGYVTSINHDGLIIARPSARRNGLPLRGIFMILMTLLMFKALVYSRLGADAYGERVAALQAGTVFERMGAYALSADPVTVWMAHGISTALR